MCLSVLLASRPQPTGSQSKWNVLYLSVFHRISMGCLMSPKPCTCFKPSKEHDQAVHSSLLCHEHRENKDVPKLSVVKHQTVTIPGQLLSFYHLFLPPLPLRILHVQHSRSVPQLHWNSLRNSKERERSNNGLTGRNYQLLLIDLCGLSLLAVESMFPN